jgi:hypothetical protein
VAKIRVSCNNRKRWGIFYKFSYFLFVVFLADFSFEKASFEMLPFFN